MNEDADQLIKRLNVPWLTEKGIDPGKLPIDGALHQTLSEDMHEFGSGCRLLGLMCRFEREEAGIYLLGLLHRYRDDLERLKVIAEQLTSLKTAACAQTLFGELKRVQCSNTTRGYLNTVIKSLTLLPKELVLAGFGELAEDRSFSYRLRTKFRAIYEGIGYREWGDPFA